MEALWDLLEEGVWYLEAMGCTIPINSRWLGFTLTQHIYKGPSVVRGRRKPGLMTAYCHHPAWWEWAIAIWVLQSKVNSRGGKVSMGTVCFKAVKWAAALTLLNGVFWRDPWAWPSSTRLWVFANFIWGGKRAGGMFSRGEKTSPR